MQQTKSHMVGRECVGSSPFVEFRRNETAVTKATISISSPNAKRTDGNLMYYSDHSTESYNTSDSSLGSDRRNNRRKMKRQGKSKLSIKFAEYDYVIEIPHFKDMSAQEIHDQWMTSEDLANIRKHCIGTVKEMNSGNEPEGVFLRGLDQHTLKYKERKNDIDRQVYDAVFRIQEFQRSSGVDASEVMAKFCAKYSEPSVVAAHTAALSDLFSSFKGTWTQRVIPDQACFDDKPMSQGAYES